MSPGSSHQGSYWGTAYHGAGAPRLAAGSELGSVHVWEVWPHTLPLTLPLTATLPLTLPLPLPLTLTLTLPLRLPLTLTLTLTQP